MTVAEPRQQVEEGEAREPLEGKVAALLNERELVITIGATDGVRPKMRFRVLAAEPVEVVDPDTGDSLGTLEREKVRVQAIDVHEAFTVCQTYETLRRPALSGLVGSELVDSPPVRTLKHGDRGYIPPITSSQSYVSIGDIVQEIVL